MLQLLEYSVEFPTTGRKFSNRIAFAPGLTAITGRNEAGKTIVLEMIGYCLFGKDALRGNASDYRDLSAVLEFTLLDNYVRIERAKKEQMWIGDELVAVGAAAINKEVPGRLGFGLDVFKIACAAQQGEIGALTEMRPTARMQMVDRLTGLNQLEAVEKDCNDERKKHSAVAEALVLGAREPVAPVKPESYQPVDDLISILSDLEAAQRERVRLSLITCPTAPEAPQAPAETDVEALEQHESQRQVALRDQARLEGQLAAIALPRFTLEQLDQAHAYQAYQAEVSRRGLKPDYTIAQLRDWEAIWDQKAQAEGKPVECPKCDHHFLPARPDVDLAAIAALATPPLTLAQITQQHRRLALWAEPLAEVAEFVIPQMQQEVQAHARAEERRAAEQALAGVTVGADRSAELRDARAYRSALAVHNERLGQYAHGRAAYEAAQDALAGIPDQQGVLDAARLRLAEARQYDAALDAYHRDSERYVETAQRIVDARAAGEGFARGAAALKATRTQVKQELAPTISQAASSLLAAMTNGERRRVEVDHEFNITVDGQPLQTLSGSGKSVVNLALRIGMGQVLTSKVLPIFMGDEIDADCDSERAGSIHTTLQALRQYLDQVLIVTHKNVEADQVISL